MQGGDDGFQLSGEAADFDLHRLQFVLILLEGFFPQGVVKAGRFVVLLRGFRFRAQLGGGGLGILPGLLFRFLPGLFLGFLFGLRFLLGLGLRLLVRLVLCGRGGRGGFRRGGLVFRIRGGAEGRGEDQAEKARRHEEGGAGPEKAGGKA